MPHDSTPPPPASHWRAEVRDLAKRKNAVILAHNYQVPEIQDVAHHVGDSLELSRIAAGTDAEVIVFCGVHFMAETAKVLSPDKRVLLPNLNAGCSLAATITAEQVRTWKADHPGAAVVMYVNTSADVKAEADYCCTSANAPQVVKAIPEDREVLFGPDMFLGAHVERVTGRKLRLWMGECHVHAGIQPSDITKTMADHPDAELLIHPECGCASQSLYLMSIGDLPPERTFVLGTGGMVARAREPDASEFVVATETGMLHRLRSEAPAARFIPANPEAVCGYMKTITPSHLLESLRHDRYEVTIPPATIERARVPIERMISLT